MKTTIAELAERTADAYSYGAYSPAGWRACCAMLRRQGYTDEQIEDILRSKLTRWAGDASTKNRYGRYTSKDLERALPSRYYIEQFLDWENRGLLGTALQRTIEASTESERNQQALIHQLLTEDKRLPVVTELLRSDWLHGGMEGDCPRCGQASGFHDDDGSCEDEQDDTISRED